MSAFLLSDPGTAIAAPALSVIGMCTPEKAVAHVGVLVNACDIKNGDEVSVHHMADYRVGLQLPGQMPAHAVGWIEEKLTERECKNIRRWVERLKRGNIEVRYSPCPAVADETDPNSGRLIRRKFSCAGFVIACFEEAVGIRLVAPEENLPEVGVQILRQVWGAEAVAFAQHPRVNKLPGPGPWKILLPSYLFHALCQNRAALPHTPAIANPAFA